LRVGGDDLVEGADRGMRRPEEHLAAGVPLKTGPVDAREVRVLLRAKQTFAAAADAIRLSCAIAPQGRVVIDKWLREVAPAPVHRVDQWCASAVETALRRPGEEVVLTISGLSTHSGQHARLVLAASRFEWQLLAIPSSEQT
jgi:hypothetical protein